MDDAPARLVVIRGWFSNARTAVPWIVAVLAVLAAVAANLWTAADAKGPIYFTDEVGYLSNAQLLSGIGTPRDLSFTSYYIGWSIPLIPLWWFSQDPADVYRGAVALSVLSSVALIAPLTFIARRLGLGAAPAVAAAAVVAAAPARVLTTGYALSEGFLTLVLALVVLAGWRYYERGTVGRASLLGLAAAGSFLIHGRCAPVLITAVLWFGSRAVRGSLPALVGLATAMVVAIPGYALNDWVAGQMYSGATDREGRGWLRLIGLDPGAAAVAGVGQAWSAVAAWGALSVIGLVILARQVWLEARRGHVGGAFWGGLAGVGLAVVSVAWIAGAVHGGSDRLDVYAYGRYLDPVSALLSLVGLAALVRADRLRLLRWAAGCALAVVVVFFLLVVPSAPRGPSAWWVPLNVSGLLQWSWPNATTATSGPWWTASLLAVLVAVLVLVARAWSLRTAAAVVGVALVVSSFVGESRTLRPVYADWYDSFTLREEVYALPDSSIAFDVAEKTATEGAGDTVSRNAYQYWLAPRTVEVFDSTTEEPETDLVIAGKEWTRADQLGAVKLADDTGLFDNALWVMPGPLQDRLRDEGVLEQAP